MKIVLITQSFPPSSNISARRWGILTRELSEYGIDFTVITRTCGNGISILNSKNILNSKACINDEKQIGEFRASKNKFLKSQLRSILSNCVPRLIDGSTFYWVKKIFDSRIRNEINNSNLIISSYGPGGVIILGSILSVMFKKPHLIDLRDSFEAKKTKGKLYEDINTTLEKYILGLACARITVGKVLSLYLSKKYQADFACIYNGTEGEIIEVANSAVDTNTIYYAGTIYDHRIDAYRCVLSALNDLKELNFHVRLIGDNLDRIISITKEYECHPRVFILTNTPKSTVDAEISSGVVPVVLEQLSDSGPEWIYGNVTGKFFELITAAKCGIVIASKKSEVFYIANKISNWQAASNSSELKNALGKLPIEKSSDVLTTFNEYSMKAQARILYEIISEKALCYAK